MQVAQAIAAFVERIKVAIFESISLTNFKSTLGNSIKSYISVIVFLKESLVQLALWKAVVIGFSVERFIAKELVISPFKTECFKAAFLFHFALGTSYNKH